MTDETGTPGAPGPEKELGWYVYAVLPWSLELPLTAGIEEGYPTALIPEGPVMAVASPVSLAAFGPEPLRRNLEDPRWLARMVCRHEAIVEAMMAQSPVLPLKFCTIFLSAERVRGMLREHAAQFQEALEFVKDKEEWGVKGFSHRGCLREAVIRRDPKLGELAAQLATQPPGRAFFVKRRLDDLAEQSGLEREDELIREAQETLRGSVVGMTRNPPLGGQALSLACLVSKNGVENFLAAIAAWNGEHAGRGLRLETSGPWPPYNFSPRIDSHAT